MCLRARSLARVKARAFLVRAVNVQGFVDERELRCGWGACEARARVIRFCVLPEGGGQFDRRLGHVSLWFLAPRSVVGAGGSDPPPPRPRINLNRGLGRICALYHLSVAADRPVCAYAFQALVAFIYACPFERARRDARLRL